MNRIIFKNTDHNFFTSVKSAVDEYFCSRQLKRTGNRKLYIKALLFIPLAILLYVFLLFGYYTALAGLALSIAFGLSLSIIAMNTMHDACHGSFSEKKWINNLAGFTMNALGSNAFLWKIKHNVLHHTYTNIDGIDNDIAAWPLLRQSPVQKRKPLHRYQHIYMFPLYAFGTLAWMFFDDFAKYFSKKISSTQIKKITKKEHLLFWISKGLYLLFYILIPAWMLGWQYWLTGFLIVHFTMGLCLTTVFQLAHLVCNTHFEASNKRIKQMASEWAVHELMTTSNFASKNKIISWFLGGLNFQVEHHLFPRISHIHYPSISPIIKEECNKYNLPYNSYSTFGEALLSHIRFMKKLGQENSDVRENL
jgi:linoleoyl-CoA desaturase